MSSICKEIREQLAEHGVCWLETVGEIKEHIKTCSECEQFIQSLTEVEGLLAQMSEADVSDEVVGRILEKVRRQDLEPDKKMLSEGQRSWKLKVREWLGEFRIGLRTLEVSTMLGVISVVLYGSVTFLGREASISFSGIASPFESTSGLDQGSGDYRDLARSYSLGAATGPERKRPEDKYADKLGQVASLSPEGRVNEPIEAKVHGDYDTNRRGAVATGQTEADSEEELQGIVEGMTAKLSDENEEFKQSKDLARHARGRDDLTKEKTAAMSEQDYLFYKNPDKQSAANTKEEEKPSEDGFRRSPIDDGHVTAKISRLVEVDESLVGNKSVTGKGERVFQEGELGWGVTSNAKPLSSVTKGGAEVAAHVVEAENAQERTVSRSKEDEEETTAVEQFLAEREKLTGLQFKNPTGYWSNTYIPGDPVVRKLEMGLKGFNRSVLKERLTSDLGLEQNVQPTNQPFDSPTDAALAVYLHADKPAIEKTSRLMLQVGIQGTERRSGNRPAMNVGLVLDLNGELPVSLASRFRTLVDAFREVKDVGDHFSLTVSGKPGGLMVPQENFAHGHLTLALNSLFATASAAGQSLNLAQAMQTSLEHVRANDDPNAPLGTSVVILVTARSLGSMTPELEKISHESAVSGVPVSVIGVGESVVQEELERIVLAGQGNRRVFATGDNAKNLVERELFAVSRIVARAVRLRIRLHPGVKLVDILGSKNLDQDLANQVRQAEASIDQRIAKNLGIEADRGEDEEGIQIIIPSFYAGDSHVILLDVVAPGPGPVADVTVRYKDLVYLRNGVARANLSLERRTSSLGPLEHNVLKNVLAFHLSDSLKQAGRLLSIGERSEALQMVLAEQTLLRGFQQKVPGFLRDLELTHDLSLLGDYLALLGSDMAIQPAQQIFLANSLAYAGYAKVLPLAN